MSITTKDRNKIYNRIRHYRMRGEPTHAHTLELAMAAGEMPDPTLMSDSGVNTDTPLVGSVDLTIPPTHGKGSGIKAWVEFAAKVTDIDSEVLQRMGRDDIIETLKARGNIPADGDE